MLSGAFISAVLGYEFKERKIIYLSQTMKFTAPVYLGDTVTARDGDKHPRRQKYRHARNHLHESERRNRREG